MVTVTVTSGRLDGSTGDDFLTGIAQNRFNQIHVYAKDGKDTINLDFAQITEFSHGHHARGDGEQGYADIFDFRNLQNVDSIIVGRIEDFDTSRDTLRIHGANISATQLAAGSGTTGGYSWRIVEFDADSTDSATGTQQWILINTGQGHVFYALEGARVTNDSSNQEVHFIGAAGKAQVTAAQLAALPTVGFVDPVNYVPAGFTAQGGVTINDDDITYVDSLETINGSSSGDLIAAGLNDDTVRAGSGDDRVWGGSGADRILGDAGHDTVCGGTGDDNLSGNDGNDIIFGDTGNDTLTGDNGNDTIRAGDGNDRMSGGAGRDSLIGGYGGDTFVFRTDHMINWNDTSGTSFERHEQLDVIADFAIGRDKIEFAGISGLDSRNDLQCWKYTDPSGDVFYVIQHAVDSDTNFRLLVDVNDSVQRNEFFTDSNIIFS